jgi:hypothetical protein
MPPRGTFQPARRHGFRCQGLEAKFPAYFISIDQREKKLLRSYVGVFWM